MVPVALGIAIALAGAAIVVAVRSRRAADEHRVAADRAAAALAAQSQSSADAQAVQTLILASMEEGVLLFAPDGAHVFANDSLSHHLGDVAPKSDRLLPIALRDAVRRAGYIGSLGIVEVETRAPPRGLPGPARPGGPDGPVLHVGRALTQ